MKCPKCNKTYDDDFDFCPYCGEKKPAPKICPNCRLEPSLEFNFCPKCGTELLEKKFFIKTKEKEWFEKAKELIELGEYEEALEYYDKLTELIPYNTNYWIEKADILIDLEEYEEALKCYNILIELEPKEANHLKEKIYCLLELEKYEEALKCYGKLTIIDPTNNNYVSDMADILMQFEKYEEALNQYDKLIKQDPKNVFIWMKKTKCLRNLKKPLTLQERELLEKYDIVRQIEGFILNRYQERAHISWKDNIGPIIYDMRFEIDIIDGYLSLLYLDNTQERFLIKLIEHNKRLKYSYSRLKSIIDEYERQNEKIIELLDDFSKRYPDKIILDMIDQIKRKLKNPSKEEPIYFDIQYLKELFYDYSERITDYENRYDLEKLIDEIIDLIAENDIYDRPNISSERLITAQKFLNYVKILTDEEILELINNSLEAKPSNKKILSLKVEYLFRLGKLEESLEICNDNDFPYQKIQILKSLKRYGEAMELCEEYSFLKEKIGILKELERYEEVLECYNDLIKETTNPYDKKKYIKEKIRLLKDIGRKEGAVECYTALIKETTFSYDKEKYIKEKIKLLKELERYDEALECYSTLLELTTSSGSKKKYAKKQGKLLIMMERYDEALELYQKNMIFDERISLLNLLIRKSKKNDKFDNYCKQLLKLNKISIDTEKKCFEEEWDKYISEEWYELDLYYLLNILESTLNNIKILKEINQLEEADKLSSETENYVYSYVTEMGGYGYEGIYSLLEVCEGLLEINSEESEYWQLKGYCLMEDLEYEDALESYDKAIELDPNNEEYWWDKGNCLKKLERYEEAEKCFKKAESLKN